LNSKEVKYVETPKKDEVRKDYEPMKVAEVGHVGDVLQGGGGKLSTSPGDPGEGARKPKPTG
jgi:hypothetical protein